MPEETTVNQGSASSSGASGASSSGNVTSGTASEAMIKAAMASSSEAPAPAGQAGDTPPPASAANTGATAEPPTPGSESKPGTEGQPADATGNRNPELEGRFKNVARNAQDKVLSYFGLTRETNPEDVKTSINLLHDFRADPKAFARELVKELGWTINENGGGNGNGQLELPKAELRSEDGKGAYSEAQMPDVIKVIAAQVRAQVMNELQPRLSFVDQAQTQQATAAEYNRAKQTLDDAMTEARTWHGFTENEAAITEKLAAMRDAGDIRKHGIVNSIYRAYHAVLNEKILPAYQTAAEARVRAENAKKANAGRAAVTGSESSGDAKKTELKNVNDLAKHLEHLSKQQVTVG